MPKTNESPNSKELSKKLLEDNARLKAENAALKKNSSNSSKPPSSDIVKPTNGLGGRIRHSVGVASELLSELEFDREALEVCQEKEFE